MSAPSRTILAFALAFFVFLILPSLLPGPFALDSRMSAGDALDLVTPIVLLPLYWALFRAAASNAPSRRETFLFLALAALWAEGHGLHLSANAIGHHLRGTDDSAAAATVADFFDEHLSHFLWHGAMIALSALAIWRGWSDPSPPPVGEGSGARAGVVLAGVLYGFTYFAVVVEGGTAAIGVPAAALAATAGIAHRRGGRTSGAVALFFTAGYAGALFFFALWALLRGGLPQFSEVGIIR